MDNKGPLHDKIGEQLREKRWRRISRVALTHVPRKEHIAALLDCEAIAGFLAVYPDDAHVRKLANDIIRLCRDAILQESTCPDHD